MGNPISRSENTESVLAADEIQCSEGTQIHDNGAFTTENDHDLILHDPVCKQNIG